MKRLIALAICAILPACGITDKPQTIQAAAFYGTYKVLENSSASAKQGRTTALRNASSDLAGIADGTVSTAEVAAVLNRYFQRDAALNALGLLLLGWFPTGAPVSPALSDLARNAALGINAALPVSPAK